MDIKMKAVDVTPTLAREILKNNAVNRPLRQTSVNDWLGIFSRGEYVFSPEGIYIADTGRLLEGQHRLTAISLMPDTFKVRMKFEYGWDESVFLVLNKGRSRSHADTLGISTGLAAVARYTATLMDTERSRGITTQSVIPYVKAVRPCYDDLIAYCGSISRTWCAAPFRTAAVLQMMRGGDRDYIKLVYHAMVCAEFDDMPPVAKTLFRQHIGGLAGSGTDMFCRAWKVFDAKNANMHKVQITDRTTTLAAARDVIAEKVFGQKKAPATVAGAKKVNGVNSRRPVIA